jgi:hypothetical protein
VKEALPMTKSRRLLWMTSVPFFAAALFLAVRAESEPEPAAAATATAAASGEPAASAAPSASTSASAAAPELPVPKGADIPAEASDKPKEKEWDTGKKVRPRSDHSAADWLTKVKPCTFTMVREWLRIRCIHRVGANLVTGDRADTTIVAGGQNFSDNPFTVLITTRMKRGETKLFTLLGLKGLGDGGGYGGFTFDSDEPIAIVWREGREDPYFLVGRP